LIAGTLLSHINYRAIAREVVDGEVACTGRDLQGVEQAKMLRTAQ